MKTSWRIMSTLTLLPLLMGVAHAHDSSHNDVFVQAAQVRKATARFHSIDNALAAGYAQFLGCVSEPGEGAMGIHFINGELIGDTVVDALRPEALMFEPGPRGKMRLVGVEYIVFQQAWDAENESPPSLFGEHFHLVESPNRYGVPAFYELHAWIWQHNPYGMFEDWNPRVRCDATGDNKPLRKPF
jgi:hypothetical protein